MRRRSRAGGEPAKPRRPKTAARKSRVTSKAARPSTSSAAREETKIARLTRELKEALQQQRATYRRAATRPSTSKRHSIRSFNLQRRRARRARRRSPGDFAQNIVDLIKTFAAQSAVAIENARLFHNVEASLQDLGTTQDRLVQKQKLASLGQLTAGIAHELKNPLNFVNNFSGVSTELIDEMRDALDRMMGDDKTRAEITEPADILRDNLNKIVQHGKRADVIVKNMLLNSREGSGEHRSVDINAMVEEALNLAYHGARAAKQNFTITLQRSFDPAAGAWPLAARAQPSERVRHLGVLMAFEENDPRPKAWLSRVTEGLAELGWTDGRNLRIDVRSAGDVDRMRMFAKQLVDLRPDVILAFGTPVTAALKPETRTIPIVFVIVSDPVGEGFVASLSHPGGNITGFHYSEASIGG
jgi:signal transduction histidine kinase